MIILLHPKAVKPKNRRFPLAILSIAAVLEGVEDYVIVDGNLDTQAGATTYAPGIYRGTFEVMVSY